MYVVTCEGMLRYVIHDAHHYSSISQLCTILKASLSTEGLNNGEVHSQDGFGGNVPDIVSHSTDMIEPIIIIL